MECFVMEKYSLEFKKTFKQINLRTEVSMRIKIYKKLLKLGLGPPLML